MTVIELVEEEWWGSLKRWVGKWDVAEPELLMFCPCGCRSLVTLREWLIKDIVHEALEYANADEDDDVESETPDD